MAKRIKLSAGGKMLRRKSHRSHMLAHKQTKTKRTYVQEFEISSGDAARVKKMLGTYK